MKQLYKQKYGEEVDQEDTDVQYDADGTPWIQISGTGVATDLRVERLEQLLSTVKDLYSEKYGRDVDTEYDADGTPWKVTEGTGVPRDCRVERLEQKLAEVKQLYKQKYGEEVDQEDTDVQYDADGTPWIQISGTEQTFASSDWSNCCQRSKTFTLRSMVAMSTQSMMQMAPLGK